MPINHFLEFSNECIPTLNDSRTWKISHPYQHHFCFISTLYLSKGNNEKNPHPPFGFDHWWQICEFPGAIMLHGTSEMGFFHLQIYQGVDEVHWKVTLTSLAIIKDVVESSGGSCILKLPRLVVLPTKSWPPVAAWTRTVLSSSVLTKFP